MPSLKVIISSKKNLQAKYGKDFQTVHNMLAELAKADSQRDLNTQIVYIDEPASASKAGITAVKTVTRLTAKRAVDALCKKRAPAYIVLFGAGDVSPFQELTNPCYSPDGDDDQHVPSDLPYACDAAYNKKISAFTGPTRVVGRIPDIQGNADLAYLRQVFDAILSHKRVKPEKLNDYFAVTAEVWKKSTQQSINNLFGNSEKLKISPTQNAPHASADLKPLVHFYNYHGSPGDVQVMLPLSYTPFFSILKVRLKRCLHLTVVKACFG